MGIKYAGPTLLLAFLLSLTAQAALAETAGETCDRLAAQVQDPALPKGVSGVDYDKIDAEPAIEACRKAVAAEPGNMRYHHQLGRALNVAKKLDQALAEFTIAADAGYAIAISAIGDMYFYGDFGTPDLKKAFGYFEKAGDKGVRFAAEYVANAYRDGRGVEKDPVKSFEWLKKAHALGSMDATVDLAWAYQQGQVVKVDLVEALRLNRIAAANNHPIGLNNVGYFYAEGVVVPMDKTVALQWFRKAEAAGAPVAYVNIAEFLDNGWAIEKNHKQAADYVIKGFELGNAEDDERNLEIFNEETWSADFWRELQAALAARNLYAGPVDGVPNEAVKAAVGKIPDKKPAGK